MPQLKSLFQPQILLSILIFCGCCLATNQLAHALSFEAITQKGNPPPDGTLLQLYQGLEISIHDQVAASRSSFQFRNMYTQELEISCQFTLAQGEMVDGFSYWNGDEQILGEVLERQSAAQVYQQLTQVRRDPGILEQEGNLFRFRVYPIAVGETKPIEVRTVTPLEMRKGWVDYRIPKQNLPTGKTIFSVKVDITDDLPIKEIDTVGFQATVEKLGDRHYRIVMEREAGDFDSDLHIRYRLFAEDHQIRFVTHRTGDADGTFMLMVSPKEIVQQNEVVGRDVVFVSDISGSMHGTPLQQSKSGIGYILEQLSPNDRFDIISFDDHSYPLFGQLRPATRSNRDTAKAAVNRFATKGGTNIRAALRRALQQLTPDTSERPRAIIFLTDGQGDAAPERVLQEVQKEANGARIYSFGVGSGINHWFLERLAMDNRGIATHIENSSEIGQKMKALYDRIAMPVMVDLDLNFEGITVHSVYPERLPDLYRDSQVVVFGRYTKPGRGRVRISGRLKNQKKNLDLEVELPEFQAKYSTIEKLWASTRVRQYLSTLQIRGSNPEAVQEITRLGIVYNLVTPYTAFLAVPAKLQTEAIKDQMRKGKRGYDRKLIDSMKGVRISQSHIPPGDPVISVGAPKDARKVVAYFPFGLIKKLRWIEHRNHWSARFLVPRDVKDGVYTIRIQIVKRNGVTIWKTIQYTIDSTAPEFEATVPEVAVIGGSLFIDVDPYEPVREVLAYLPDVKKSGIPLLLNPDNGRYQAEIEVPDDLDLLQLRVRIVVRDLARNRFQRDYILDLLPPIESCGCYLFDDDHSHLSANETAGIVKPALKTQATSQDSVIKAVHRNYREKVGRSSISTKVQTGQWKSLSFEETNL